MNDKDKSKGKLTLDIELQDILDIVSKSTDEAAPISGSPSPHAMEGEDIKKAWFRHMLISMEKLGNLVETIRREDLVNLRRELKEEINKIELKIVKAEDELKVYKKDVIYPINNKVIALTVKVSLWGLLGGIFGSGLMGLFFFLIREFIAKSAATGGP